MLEEMDNVYVPGRSEHAKLRGCYPMLHQFAAPQEAFDQRWAACSRGEVIRDGPGAVIDLSIRRQSRQAKGYC